MSQETIKFKSGGADITAELFSPPVVGKHPLVIMAYGTGGMMAPFGPMYISFADGLAKAGVFCLLPDYLAKTKTPHDLEMWNSLSTCRTAWVSALCDAVTNVMTLSQVDVSRVALGGFSLGGNLMIHAAQTNRAKAFVDFFAPIVSKLDPGSQIAAPMASSQQHQWRQAFHRRSSIMVSKTPLCHLATASCLRDGLRLPLLITS